MPSSPDETEEADKPSGKKPKGKDPLGKLLGEFKPAPTDPMAVAGVMVFALLGVGGLAAGAFFAEWRTYLLIGGGIMIVIAGFKYLILTDGGGAKYVIEVRKRGIRWRTPIGKEDLTWEEIDYIQISRTQERSSVQTQAYAMNRRRKMSQEVLLHHPNGTMHFTTFFLEGMDDPNGLIKLIRRHSGREFRHEIHRDDD